jgi:hypothetical protein
MFSSGCSVWWNNLWCCSLPRIWPKFLLGANEIGPYLTHCLRNEIMLSSIYVTSRTLWFIFNICHTLLFGRLPKLRPTFSSSSSGWWVQRSWLSFRRTPICRCCFVCIMRAHGYDMFPVHLVRKKDKRLVDTTAFTHRQRSAKQNTRMSLLGTGVGRFC